MLRKYQQDIINQTRNNLKTYRSCLIVAPCGAGKSVIMADIAKSATKKQNRVLFLVHRRELKKQIESTFEWYGVDMNYCQVGLVQTIRNRLNTTTKPSLILTDESHHSKSDSYVKIYEYFNNSYLVGCTATPTRLSGESLGDIYKSMVDTITVKWLIGNNYLAPYNLYSVPLAYFGDVKVSGGDYKRKTLDEILSSNKIYGDVVENYKRIAENKKTIVYCNSIIHSNEVAQYFTNCGYSAVSLSSRSNKEYRDSVMNDFRDNKINILCNVDLFSEGVDVPDVEVVILLRKTKSLTTYIQQAMRCMRFKEGKTAIIIDHVGNYAEHGLPDDDREWSLQTKKREKSEITIKQCPVCYAYHKSDVEICDCGYVWEKTIQKRKEKELIEQELVLIEKWQKRAVSDVSTWDELELFRKGKGYKFYWSLHYALKNNIDIPSKYNSQLRRIRK